MTAPLTRGQLEAHGEGVALLLSLNDALRRIRDELDELHGLRGTQGVYGGKTFHGVAVRFEDGDGNLVHAWGATE